MILKRVAGAGIRQTEAALPSLGRPGRPCQAMMAKKASWSTNLTRRMQSVPRDKPLGIPMREQKDRDGRFAPNEVSAIPPWLGSQTA